MYEIITRTDSYPITGESTSRVHFEMFSDDLEELQELKCWKDVEQFIREKKKHIEIKTIEVQIYGPKCDPCTRDRLAEENKKMKILTGVALGASIGLSILALLLKLFGM